MPFDQSSDLVKENSGYDEKRTDVFGSIEGFKQVIGAFAEFVDQQDASKNRDQLPELVTFVHMTKKMVNETNICLV